MAKANLVRCLKENDGYGVTAFYEYRGREYMVRYCNNGCTDDMYVGRIHREEQEKIDEELDHPEIKNQVKEYKGPDYMKLLDVFYEED